MGDDFVWSPDALAFRIGFFPVHYYTLFLLSSFVGGFFLWRWQAKRGGLGPASSRLFGLALVPVVIYGSRFAEALFYSRAWYMENPWELLKFWHGGFASHGAVVGMILAVVWYAKAQKRPVLDVLDRLTFSSALGAGLVRLGNFANSEIVGRETTVSWGVRFRRYDAASVLRHPSQLYEFGFAALIFVALFVIDRIAGKEDRPTGLLTGFFLFSYFTARFIVEFFKEYQTLPPDSFLTMGHYLSIPGIVAGAVLLCLVWFRRTQSSGR